MTWTADVLGDGFEAYAFTVSDSSGQARRATLVRHITPDGPAGSLRSGAALEAGPVAPHRRAVLFLHGWSDYFFNTELATFWAESGYSFFALDLHNHGRSIQTDSPNGYVADLEHYDAEIDQALQLLNDSTGASDSDPTEVTLMGHSTGGLVATLWLSRNPGRVARLVLNSPWLEMHGSSLVRRVLGTMLSPISYLRPEAVMKLPQRGYYWRSISDEADGEWTLDRSFRPPYAFPVRAGWLSAVLSGQDQVAKGLDIDVPVLVLMSASSQTGMAWTENMRTADAVLDVNTMAARSLALGQSVTVERVSGALHDVFLSREDVRVEAYFRLSRWLGGYAPPAGAASTAAP